MSPTFTLSATDDGRHELTLGGRFKHPHWVAFLLAGLAEHRVSVVSGRASQLAPQQWEARFLLDFHGCSLAPDRLDFVGLCENERRLSGHPPPDVTGFFVTRRPDKALELRLEGPDQIGFLGRMLAKLCMLMLFPSELRIDTVNGRIEDVIVLRGVAGSAPPESLRGSLENMLVGLARAA